MANLINDSYYALSGTAPVNQRYVTRSWGNASTLSKANVQYFTCNEYQTSVLTAANNYIYIPDALSPLNGNIYNPYENMCNQYKSTVNSKREQLVEILPLSNRQYVTDNEANYPKTNSAPDIDSTVSSKILIDKLNELKNQISADIKRRNLLYLFDINLIMSKKRKIIDDKFIDELNNLLCTCISTYSGTVHSVDGEVLINKYNLEQNPYIPPNLIPTSELIANINSKIELSTFKSHEKDTNVSTIIDNAAVVVNDCVCYSDCGGYSVCYCYGNCNFY